MKVTPHSPRAAFVGVDQLPVSSEARPKPLSDEDAEAEGARRLGAAG